MDPLRILGFTIGFAIAFIIMWKLASSVLTQPKICEFEVDGLRVVWREFGWTGAEPEVFEWEGTRWAKTPTDSGSPRVASEVRRALPDGLERMSMKAIQEVEAFIKAWQQRPLNRRPQ